MLWGWLQLELRKPGTRTPPTVQEQTESLKAHAEENGQRIKKWHINGLLRMRKKKLKGNERLGAVYGNAASALTVHFNDPKAKRGKPASCPPMPAPFDPDRPNVSGRKPL